MNTFDESKHPRDKEGKFTKLGTKELKEICKIDYGKFVKSGETTELIPEIKKGEYNGSDKYPRTARRYRFEEIEGPKIVNIDLSADIQKAFDNASPRERTKIARSYILNNLRGKYLAKNSIEINITRKTAKEITNATYEPKIRVSPELANIITVSDFIATRKATHGKFNRFLYYKTLLRIKDKKYSAILNVGVDKDNNCVLYDINQFEKH